MKGIEIKPDIYWVGAIDWSVRDFHGYVTPNGTTYNNFLILDEKITLVDTVNHGFVETMLEAISNIVSPEKIDIIVINHIEPDHAGSLDQIMDIAKNATIYTSEKGKQGLAGYFDIKDWKIQTVKTGDELKIGKKTLLFIETPMLHWPDSMVTYVKEDKLLISQDIFGQHYASSSRFDDQVPEADINDAVIDYYANILMPFGLIIKNKIAEIQKLCPDLNMIAPDHGVIWRGRPDKVVGSYLDMANGKAEERAVIIYDTMWKSTEEMVLPIMEGVKAGGVDVKVIKLRATPMSVAMKELWRSRGFIIGTPTLNNTMYPSIAEFLTHLRGLRPKSRISAAFGSYGWGGGAVKEAYAELKRMNLESFEPGIEVKYKPTEEDLKVCYDFGKEFAARLKEYHGKIQQT